MDRHNGKQLAERPVIEQRLENGKIADVLIAQPRFKAASLRRAHNAGRDAY